MKPEAVRLVESGQSSRAAARPLQGTAQSLFNWVKAQREGRLRRVGRQRVCSHSGSNTACAPAASVVSAIAGERCGRLMDRMIQDVPVRDVQADEIWSFIGKKQKHMRLDDHETLGDSYTWVAIEARTKLILAFLVGKRTSNDAFEFTSKLRRATSAKQRFQLTTDGLQAYIPAVDLSLSDRCDYAQLIKIYSSPREGEQRYSPSEVVEAVPVVISGSPNPNRICTSHIERQNLTMQTQIRRLTRLTNVFSKKYENHKAAIALHFAYYNFCKLHQTLRVTPAMEAGITAHLWTISELINGTAR